MKLEDEIKQSKFRNEFHKLAVNILYSYSWLVKSQTEAFKCFNITANQFNILRILRGQYPNPASVNLLRERMLDKMSDASRLVERLRLKGFVKRELCDSDRRSVNVSITEKGLALLSEMDKIDIQSDAVFCNLSDSETKILNDLLDKMRG